MRAMAQEIEQLKASESRAEARARALEADVKEKEAERKREQEAREGLEERVRKAETAVGDKEQLESPSFGFPRLVSGAPSPLSRRASANFQTPSSRPVSNAEMIEKQLIKVTCRKREGAHAKAIIARLQFTSS